MPSTRTTTKFGRSGKITKPSPKKQKRGTTKPSTAADRALRALEIDGTAVLGGKKPAPEASGQTACTSKAPSLKRKREATTAPQDDLRFLGDAQRQLRGLKVPRTSSRRHEADQILAYLRHMKAPTSQRTPPQSPADGQQQADAYLLSSADARGLLASNASIDAPVFVAGAANTASVLETGSDRRPVEQLFDWLVDPDEKHDVHEPTGTRQITTGELRQRFLDHNGYVEQPYNFPDVASPFHTSGMPDFVQTPACNLLRDVMRYLLDVSPVNICQDDCKGKKAANRCCNKHFLTTGEFAELQQGWRHWQGSVMLAEAGALTLPHVDKWGFGTFLSCLEGEMGFAWLSHTSDEQLEAVLAGTDAPDEEWLFKVLRPGDAVYMSPGTPHLVFRLPQGKQTMGLAGHLVRRCDVEQWVQLVMLDAEQGEYHDAGFGEVVRGLATGIEHILTKAAGRQDIVEQYSGAKKMASVRKALVKLKRMVK